MSEYLIMLAGLVGVLAALFIHRIPSSAPVALVIQGFPLVGFCKLLTFCPE
jgi:hypothetical protein